MQLGSQHEIIRVFALYYGQTVRLTEKYSDGFVSFSPGDSLTLDNNVLTQIVDGRMKAKLLLTSLNEITDEHAIELVCKSAWKRTIENPIVTHLNEGISIGNNSGAVSMFWHSLNYKEHQYLLLKGYAVPLYFGIDHWANGMSAIELHLAFSKTSLT